MAPTVNLPQPVMSSPQPQPGSLAVQAPKVQGPAPVRTRQSRLNEYPETWWNPDAKERHDSQMETAKIGRYNTIANMVLGGMGEYRAQQGEGRKAREESRVNSVRAELDRLDTKQPGAKDRVIALLAQLNPVAAAQIMARDLSKKPRIVQTSSAILILDPDTGAVIDTIPVQGATKAETYKTVTGPDGTQIVPASQLGSYAGKPGYSIGGPRGSSNDFMTPTSYGSTGPNAAQQRASESQALQGLLESLAQSRQQTSAGGQ